MKTRPSTYHKYRIFIAALFAFLSVQLLFVSSAHSQIDFYYGKNYSGLRMDAGPGFSNLMTHYNSNPLTPIFVGDLDYAFNPYFSIGVNGQIGHLIGKDVKNEFYYQESNDSYYFANLNMKFGVGLISDFNSRNQLTDALKRLYVGLGGGIIHTNIVFTYNNSISTTTLYGSPQPNKNLQAITFDVGTYIDLPGFRGPDKWELCPNFQFNYVNSLYLDGFQSKATSTLKGFFNVSSLTLRYKFE